MKLGGSVLTDKAGERAEVRADVLARLAQEIAAVPGRYVVLHGAGSFGHPLARKHRLKEGRDGTREQALGFAQVHADVRRLDLAVLDALREAGLPAVSLSPFDLARLGGGEILSFAYGPVSDALAEGLVPVLHGDAVLDAGRGWSILSADVLMVEMARAFRPSRCVFVTDVDGIHDRDPREEGARLLSRIGPQDLVGAGAATGADVTGGMAGKLRRARDVARAGAQVHVVNGLAPGRLRATLAGEATLGTVVTA